MRTVSIVAFALGLAACAGENEGVGAASGAALSTTSACSETATTPCTPAPGTALRKRIADDLRRFVRKDLAKNGVAPADADVVFVFKTMLVRSAENVADGVTGNGEVFVQARIVKSDGQTPFDFEGTLARGDFSSSHDETFVNNVDALFSLEPGGDLEFAHVIGYEVSQATCWWWKYDLDPALFPRIDQDSVCQPMIGGAKGDGIFDVKP